MMGRLDSLEKYMASLTTRLQHQEQRNSELVAALAQKEQQRNVEKAAFIKAVGVLQGAVTQLSTRVNVIPRMLEQDKRNKYKQSLSSTLNLMSEKIGELGNRLDRNAEQHIQVRDTRSQTTGELLGKLLGKDVEKALEGVAMKNNKNDNGEAKDGLQTVASVAPVSSVIATNTQPMIPMDLLPESHMTSLSTPSGQGPAGSVTTNPIVPNLSYVQVPSQTNIPAPSTPIGSGPVGSVSTMPISNQALVADPLKTVSLTSVASKFKPPVNVAGYNVLPLAPATAVQTQALESPSIVTTQPGLPSLVAPDQLVPGVINPYEVLTSSQMQPKVAQPVEINPAIPFIAPNSQLGNPYEVLTTSQSIPPGHSVVKEKVIQKNTLGKKGKIRKISRKGKEADQGVRNTQIISDKNKAQNKWKNIRIFKTSRVKQFKRKGKKTLGTKSLNDPLGIELKKALKMGELKKVGHPITLKKKQQ